MIRLNSKIHSTITRASKDDTKYILKNLNSLYNTSHIITKDQLQDKIYNKFNKYHKVQLKDLKGSIHFVVEQSAHDIKPVAENNYDKITKRLNQLHVSPNLLDQLEYYEFHNNDIYIDLNISVYKEDERQSEWDL